MKPSKGGLGPNRWQNAPPTLMDKVKGFFVGPEDFDKLQKAYWKARGGAKGGSLHHWLFSQSSPLVPARIRNAGFNLLEIPGWARGGRLGFNEWMGFAQKWGGTRAGLAADAEELVRIGVVGAGVVSGWGGYKIGTKIAEYTMPDEGN